MCSLLNLLRLLRAGRSGDAVWRDLLLLSVLGFLSLLPLLPVLTAPLDFIPVTRGGSATVPLFNAWTILWNVKGIERGFQGWWDAPIFFPERQCFAFSEPMPLTACLQPLVRIFGSVALAYNCWLAGNLFLNGVTACWLLRRCGCSCGPAAAAGCAMTLHPLLLTQLEVLQLTCLWPSLWLLSTLLRIATAAADPAAGYGHCARLVSEAALAVICLPATCVHHTLFFGLLLLFAGWALVPWRSFLRWLLLVCGVAVLALPPAAMMLLPVQQVLRERGFERREETVAVLSAVPSDYLRAPEQSVASVMPQHVGRPWNLGAGWLRTVLATAGMMLVFGNAGLPLMRRLVLSLSLLLLAAALLSLGVNLQLGPWKIWAVLCDWLPGMAQVRSAFRFALFVQVAIILLAGIGLDRLQICFLRRAGCSSRTQRVIVVCLGLLVAGESWSVVPGRVDVPRIDVRPGWAEFLQSRAVTGEGVLILPYVQGHAPDDFQATVRWMIHSTVAGLRIVNGYSGFFPPAHFTLQRDLQRAGLESSLILQLQSGRVFWVVVTDSESDKQAQRQPLLREQWRSADGSEAVFEVVDRGQQE